MALPTMPFTARCLKLIIRPRNRWLSVLLPTLVGIGLCMLIAILMLVLYRHGLISLPIAL